MDTNSANERLTRIETLKGVLREAQGAGDPAVAARQRLVLLYHGAVHRYLLGMLRNADAASELAQDFALRFMRGDFMQADPERGRFRDYLKTALRNMVFDYWDKPRAGGPKRPQPLQEKDVPCARGAETKEAEAALLAGLRDELLARTWDALAQFEKASGTPSHTVLDLKVRATQDESVRPLRSAELAAELQARHGLSFTPAGVRQALHRAREQFADLLIEEVLSSLLDSEPERLEEELIELELLSYCRSALARRTAKK
jgi:RNA polymerase sigma-70 factor (ECF subfamily)